MLAFLPGEEHLPNVFCVIQMMTGIRSSLGSLFTASTDFDDVTHQLSDYMSYSTSPLAQRSQSLPDLSKYPRSRALDEVFRGYRQLEDLMQRQIFSFQAKLRAVRQRKLLLPMVKQIIKEGTMRRQPTAK
ncbi:hypothetical protein L596_005547 [Steinernema carpocapsae]|uniref:Uncharacterized protein n=1 Tax=Steinernema carpocapsae TaxID=34508 RepID=A0A4U8V0T3_STECR|nr:hypothetical protein L596_005547 [Steinernema carpocapsae]